MTGLQFSSIHINKDHYQEYSFLGNKEVIDNLSQVNIFIGKNNSGKSRLMRKIFTDEDISFNTKEIDIENFNNLLLGFKQQFEKITLADSNHYTNYKNYKNSIQDIQPFSFLKKRIDHSGNLKALQSIINTFNQYGYKENSGNKALRLTYDFLKTYKEAFHNPSNISEHNYKSIYIPTLRGLRPIQTNSSSNDSFNNNSDSYLHRTNSDYFKKVEKSDSIYTGLSFYNDINKYSRGNPTLRKQLADFKRFLSETFFNGVTVDLIPNINDDVVHVEIGDNEEPIHNLGDGIQALIIITYPLFFNQDKVLKVFIEEPETHLHPGYQPGLLCSKQLGYKVYLCH